ncbi:MAG: M23 family metallopeptidase, partial [Chthoniobacterales bacterium]|nr:M23 family metallopeptidase [Chthoniobacterales bacterium]
MKSFWFWFLLLGFVASLVATPSPETARTRLADGFDFPVGKPNAEGYYIARGFLPYHPGEDWNSLNGGNSDLGAPVYSIGNGLVVFARDAKRGWGNVVIIRHVFFSGGRLQSCDSFYAHLERVTVREGQHVLRGTQVGTIGTNRGMYVAHLHFEIRRNLAIGIHRSAFRNDLKNYYLPSEFIRAHRQLPGSGRSALVAINTFTLPNSMFDPPINESLYARRFSSR